jgi:hypothetical protein
MAFERVPAIYGADVRERIAPYFLDANGNYAPYLTAGRLLSERPHIGRDICNSSLLNKKRSVPDRLMAFQGSERRVALIRGYWGQMRCAEPYQAGHFWAKQQLPNRTKRVAPLKLLAQKAQTLDLKCR